MLTNYPSSFDLSLNVRNTFFFNSTITKNIMAGSNSVKIYPNETLILNTAYDIELEMVFSKFEYVYVNGKKYEYYRRFIRTYPAKLID